MSDNIRSVDVGQPAPDFALKDQNNEVVSLASFAGEKNVVLIFHPLAFTGICEGELCAVQSELPTFENDDVQVLSISVAPSPSHKVWANQQGFTFPLLSDFWPHGAVAQAYGCFDETKGVATRATYVIDKAGIVRWKTMNAIPDARDHAEYAKALAEL
ncbi:MAG TPA: peroxiredoxin [Mycobacteriales bacterium]|nr:peroxiredoxin [Mycobacteriales bacterium]